MKEWRPEDAPLVPLTSKHFVISRIEEDCTIDEFCEVKNLQCRRLNKFLDYRNMDKSDIGCHGIRDVILMDKVDITKVW